MVSFGRRLTRAGIGCCVELPLPTASQNQSWWCKHAVTWAGWLIVFFHTLRKPNRVCSPQEEVCCRRHFKFSKYVLNLDMDISMTVWCWSYASETGNYQSIYIPWVHIFTGCQNLNFDVTFQQVQHAWLNIWNKK